MVSFGILLPEVIAEEKGTVQLLRDDYVFAGVDGKLVRQTDGGQVPEELNKWLFEFESGLSDGRAEVKEGQTLEMLPSGTLEKMIEDAKGRVDVRYRLWGKAVKFGGKNYIFPVYFVGLSKLDKPAVKPQQDSNSKKAPAVNAPNDVLNIPDEIVAKLQTSEVLPTEETQEGLQLKQDTVYAGRTGFVVEKENRYVFEPDGLGRGIEKSSLELLPCQKLEEAIAQVRGSPSPVRFNVAGVLTRYKDGQFLLLQKATRAYSYGNFGK
jgi:hypothetical protein